MCVQGARVRGLKSNLTSNQRMLRGSYEQEQLPLQHGHKLSMLQSTGTKPTNRLYTMEQAKGKDFILEKGVKYCRCEGEKSVTVTVVCKADPFTSICSSFKVLTGVKSCNDSSVYRPVSSGPPKQSLHSEHSHVLTFSTWEGGGGGTVKTRTSLSFHCVQIECST